MTTKRKATFIKPGFLVVGHVETTGCTSYVIEDRVEKVVGNQERANWKTSKVVKNIKEQKTLGKTGTSLIRKISRLGAHIGGFGYLIPLSKQKELEQAIKSVDEGVDEYNSLAKDTRLFASVAVFQIDASDDRVAMMLYNKTAELLTRIGTAIAEGNIVELRRQVQRMKGLDAILPDNTAKKLGEVLKQAKEAAKLATKEIKELDETKAIKKAKQILKTVPIEATRMDMIEFVGKVKKRVNKKRSLDPVNARQID